MIVDPNDLIGRHILLSGQFDDSIPDLLVKFANPDDVLVDVGANIGYVSCRFLKAAPEGRVIAVEPQSTILPLLEENLRNIDNDSRYQIVPAAFSTRNGQGWLTVNPLNKGASYISDSVADGTEEIRLCTPATVFEELALERIDLLKIDVEGHELSVLTACKTELRKFHPRAILFEDHTRQAAPDGAIGSLLTELEYRIFGVKKRLFSIDLVEIQHVHECVYTDYLAVSMFKEMPSNVLRRYGRALDIGRAHSKHVRLS